MNDGGDKTMLRKMFLIGSVGGLFIMSAGFVGAEYAAMDQKTDRIAKALQDADARMKRVSLMATVEQSVNHLHPDFGTVTWKCTYSRSQNQTGLSFKDASYSGIPAYRPPRPESGVQPGVLVLLPGNVHDGHGNLVVYRPKEKHILRLPDQLNLYDAKIRIQINPKNEIESIGQESALISTYPPSQRLFDLEAILFATGRGYSEYITRIVKSEPIAGGRIRLMATGFYNVAGNWILEVDPQEEYLVRKATFISETGRTMFVCQTGGIVRSDKGLAVATQSTISLPLSTGDEMRMTMTIHSVCLEDDPDFLTSLRRIFSQPPGHVHTRLDYRGNPSKPIIEPGDSKR
jgi:hypothetical protein